MNAIISRFSGRFGLVLAATVLSSCALPREEAWRIIRTDGLIPYLALELNHRDAPSGPMMARRAPAPQTRLEPSRYWQPLTPATVAVTPPTASPIMRTPPAPVLITRSSDGSSSSTTRIASRPRSLDSGPSSSAPIANIEAPAPKVAPLPPVKSAAEAVGATPAPAPAPKVVDTKPKDSEAPKSKPAPEAPTKPKVVAETPAPQPAQQKPVASKPTAEETPYGVPVPGRPGLVNSPYAGKSQLVDVTGLKSGQEVKCPYSGKLFRVPPGATAEAKQSTDESKKP